MAKHEQALLNTSGEESFLGKAVGAIGSFRDGGG